MTNNKRVKNDFMRMRVNLISGKRPYEVICNSKTIYTNQTLKLLISNLRLLIPSIGGAGASDNKK
jgi:hypothetical protein